MFSKDLILHKRGLFPRDSCKRVIDFFESNPSRHRDDFYPDLRKFTFVHNDSNPNDRVFNLVIPTLNEIIKEYVETYPILNDSCKFTISDDFKIQKYDPGDAYSGLHCENDGPRDDRLFRRILAWMIYLNDVKDNGYTEFPYQNRKFHPRVGDTLIWPAYFTHPHRGIPSKTQTKYIITGWYWFLDKNY